jgi:lipopolysaccharide/colanic/teichoic acid biosynthesis glycosyltransferase/UDP-N-acetylmuramyl pentapeptide phosphotransferase/UDP-N-acetylglucosamine-1-phosphate transferase
MNDILIILAIPLAISFLLSMFITQRMRIISYNGGFYFNQNKDEILGMEMGGLSLFPIMLISMCITMALPHLLNMEELRQQVEPTTMRILQIIVGCAFLYIMGVKDDFHGTSSMNKFFVLFLAAAMFPASGLWINNLYGLFGLHAIPMWVGMPFTLLVALFLTELPCIIDSPDGLATGIGTLLAVLFLLLSIYGNHAMSTIIASATIGVTLPFTLCKKFDKRWEKTLMGSSGNYILGYILSYLTIALTRQSGGRLPEEAIIICVGITIVPVLDAVRVLKSRIVENRGILTPDKNQMQHRLIRTGMPEKFVSLTITLIILGFTLLNLACAYFRIGMTIIFFIDIVMWAICAFLIDWCIARHEAVYAHEQWNKEYGREAWEANIPTETLSNKIKNFGTMGLSSDMLSGNTQEFIADGMTGFGRSTKRICDFIFSGCSLILFSPLFLLCYIMIKLDDGGPAIYKQERIGRFGRPFTIYKFRSMKVNAEEAGPALSHANGQTDPRLTRIGGFLRAHHLDELPQLWNVFTGDMAFIGYRPERKFYIDQIMEHDPRYAFLYQIRPGVTSYATLNYGYTDTMEKMLRRLELDLYYLKNRSWWFDCKVLFLTFVSIIFGKKF